MFREKNHLLGGGSAAAIWASGAIGLLCGTGLVWLAAIVGVLVLGVLVISDPLISRTAVDGCSAEGDDSD